MSDAVELDAARRREQALSAVLDAVATSGDIDSALFEIE